MKLDGSGRRNLASSPVFIAGGGLGMRLDGFNLVPSFYHWGRPGNEARRLWETEPSLVPSFYRWGRPGNEARRL